MITNLHSKNQMKPILLPTIMIQMIMLMPTTQQTIIYQNDVKPTHLTYNHYSGQAPAHPGMYVLLLC